MLRPEFVQRFASGRSVGDNALRFWSIHNLPELADLFVGRKLRSKLSFETPTSPDSLHENGIEGEGSRDYRLATTAGELIADRGFQIGNL